MIKSHLLFVYRFPVHALKFCHIAYRRFTRTIVDHFSNFTGSCLHVHGVLLHFPGRENTDHPKVTSHPGHYNNRIPRGGNFCFLTTYLNSNSVTSPVFTMPTFFVHYTWEINFSWFSIRAFNQSLLLNVCV